MKIALPTRPDATVDDHFGHCACFTIVTVEEGRIVASSTVPAPEGCGCRSGVASTLRQMGVDALLAGNMGEGARQVLEAQQIRVVRGCSGAVEEVVGGFLAGRITDSGQGCAEAHAPCHPAAPSGASLKPVLPVR